MDYSKLFQDFLFSQKNTPSKATVKNYTADVRRFIRWYENRFHEAFDPQRISVELIREFRRDQTISPMPEAAFSQAAARSVERYMSSLKKFFTFLKTEEVISSNPFDLLVEAKVDTKVADPWQMNGFKNFLYTNKASKITIKNYIIDISQFTSWLETVNGENDHFDLSERNLFTQINPFLLSEYKNRLLNEAKVSPTTVNRKLSSLRKYITWCQEQGLVKEFEETLLPKNTKETGQGDSPISETTEVRPVIAEITPEELVIPQEVTEPPASAEETIIPTTASPRLSAFPPFRLLQRVGIAGTFVSDHLFILPTLAVIDKMSYLMWLAKGSPVFIPTNPNTFINKPMRMLKQSFLLQKVAPRKPKLIASLPKSFYAPLAVSLRHAPLYKKILFHLRYTRPAWYKKYHTYSFVHYLHAAILVFCMAAGGFGIVQAMRDSGNAPIAFASLPEGPPRILSFKGKLTRTDSSPITTTTPIRFTIYNDATASGSAMLWEEVQSISPTADGSFSTLLGQYKGIPQHLFEDNARLFVGMTVQNDPEMTPRKQIPTEVLAATADSVQGLRPITDPRAGGKNAILTLNSSGDLVIGGSANPRFLATGGVFTLAGETLLLTTTPGSNTDVKIVPDGLGKIDLMKPVHNTSEDISPSGLTGAVEIEDTVAISASQSGQSALYINQNATGPLISASSSGIAKFTLDYNGGATFGDSIMLYGNSLSTTQASFNLLTTNPINLNFGTSATALSIGAGSGVATINNSQTVVSGNLNVNGTTGLTFGNASAGINFSGQGNHLITASSGSLQLGTVSLTGTTTLGNNVSILPGSADGENNLGSASNPFDTLYVNSIVSSSVNGFSQWQSQNGILSPTVLTQSLLLGSTASESAVWQVFASGANAGTASSSGNLAFTDTTTTIDQLNGGSIQLRTSPGGDAGLTPQLTLSNTGNVGLGTTTPAYRLDLPNNADGTGQARANAWVTYSSRRYKENITVITNPLDKINQLQGVYYNWKAEYGGSRDIGFIAEEVGKVLPELVEYEADGVNAKSLKYDRITALAVEGIKAQQDELTSLKGMVNSFALTENKNLHILPLNEMQFAVQTETGEEITTKGGFAQAVIGTLQTGLTTAKKLTTDSLTATQGMVTALQADSVKAKFLSIDDVYVNGHITAANAAILSLRTDTIEATGDDNNFSVQFGKQGIIFYGLSDNQKTAVGGIDQFGNAQFTGSLMVREAHFADITADTISVTDTIQAKKVVAEELDLSDAGLMQLAARITPYLPKNTEKLPSKAIDIQPNESVDGEIDLPDTTASPSAVPPLDNAQDVPVSMRVTSEYDPMATSAAALRLAPPVTPASPENANLMGTSLPSGAGYVVSDLSVADTLTVSGNFILSNNSIDVVGADFEIQPLKAGGVSFMAGMIKITPGGDLSVNGNAFFARDVTVKGQLAAHIISPIDDNDLVVKLDQKKNQALVIGDASSEAQLKVKNGDVETEGQGNFGSLLTRSLNVMRASQADASPVSTVASSSAGTAIILPGQTERTIITPFVNGKSLIYLTPTSDTQGSVPYVARQTAEDLNRHSQGSFTIEIPDPVTKPIKVNWWIVN